MFEWNEMKTVLSLEMLTWDEDMVAEECNTVREDDLKRSTFSICPIKRFVDNCGKNKWK